MKALEILKKVSEGISAKDLDVKYVDCKNEYAYILSEDKGLIRVLISVADYTNVGRLVSFTADAQNEEELSSYIVGVEELKEVLKLLENDIVHITKIIEKLQNEA